MSDVQPYKNQEYERLKRRHNASNLFVDHEFASDIGSLFPSGRSSLRSGRSIYDIEWRRPQEFCDSPMFVVDGFKCGDLDQGELGNCWFIAAANALVMNGHLRERSVPENQSFSEDDYAGIFHFRFWVYGVWYDVVIDDQLPWHPEIGLIFCKNRTEKNEMWSSLLEKAYAKLCGSYEAIIGGRVEDGLVDLTGGLGEVIKFSERRARSTNFIGEIQSTILQAYHNQALIGCSITSRSNREQKLQNGLIEGHAYTITGVADVDTRFGRLTLIRCLNPWGDDTEWNGRFSDHSDAWSSVTHEDKRRLSLKKNGDGEFWISLEDFIENFSELQICHQTVATFQAEHRRENAEKFVWRETMFHGSWVPGSTAGGCGNDNPENFWRNPQFIVHVSSSSSFDQRSFHTLLIFLMIKIPHERHLRNGEDRIPLQIRVFKVVDDENIDDRFEQGSQIYDRHQLKLVKDSGTYINSPALSLRIDATSGKYVIIPSTFHSNTAGDFLLRVFTDKNEHTEDYGINTMNARGNNEFGDADDPTEDNSGFDSSDDSRPGIYDHMQGRFRIDDQDRACSLM